ncbi:MAG: hypothetical protein AAFU03_00805, partial [Bacteroidota bacterium]
MKYSFGRSAVLTILLCWSLTEAQAQDARFFSFHSSTNQDQPSLIEAKMMCNSDAGDIMSFGPFIGQSNDVTGDTIFFCFGDSLFVDHDDNSIDLSGDPIPGTPAGIGYAFYDCPPTVTGQSLGNIIDLDPCFTRSPLNDSLIIASGGNLNGDDWFFNLGQVQAFLSMGAPEPQVIWFAPITYDRLNPSTLLAQYEREGNQSTNPLGPCVNVSVDQAFAIAYLNELTISDVNLSGCQGTFRVQGGLPELDGSTYFIEAELTTDPSVMATIQTTNVSHDGVVSFEVPQPGDYRITVTDNKSCPATQVVTLNSCDAVGFCFGFENHLPGESFCVPVTVTGYTNVLGFQFTINFDNDVL